MDLADVKARILDAYQRGFPVVAEPYAEIARTIGCPEADVLAAFQGLLDSRQIDRVGAVLAPGHSGVSTLAAIQVPIDRLVDVAEIVNRYPEVNHNYAREGAVNLWFVVHARSEAHLQSVLSDMAAKTGLPVHDLRLEEEFRIDLGFPL